MSENQEGKNDFGSVEYRIKPVTRYIVTRHEEGPDGLTGSTSQRGEYDNPDIAWEVGYALCMARGQTRQI